VIWKQVFIWALEWGAGKLASWISLIFKRKKQEEDRKKESDANLERLENAKTEEEIERAAKDTLSL
jgi:hypothetical protein